MNLIIATGYPEIVEAVSENSLHSVLASCASRDELESTFERLPEAPDVLVAIEGFDCQGSSAADILIGIKKRYPSVRIIYILGGAFTSGTKKILSRMVENGIYDIAIGDELDAHTIEELIDNPKGYGDASKILETDDGEVCGNIFTISSLKPGTGKTLLATNLAVAIAKYGQKKRMKTGKLVDPRVLLIDGDLLNLGVGSTLKTDNYDKNMLTALQKIAKEVSEDGSYSMDNDERENLKKYVRSCLCAFKDCENLYIMGANSISIDELSKIAPAHFYFMILMLYKAFDVIIIDSNSAFDHQTTAVLYELSGHIYLMLDNDYNNIQNNLRYIGKLTELGYNEKIKFIVNKDITREAELECLEDLAYDTSSVGDLVIDYRIPLVDAGRIKTLEYENELLVLSQNEKDKAAKEKIIEIANDIWGIDGSKLSEPQKEKPKKPNRLISLLNS